jgi:tetratricopeptide (TPR) repeat protein
MFEEALDVARRNPYRDRWAEARALTSLTSVISPVGDEQECLELGQQALEIGRKMGDRFTVGVAQEIVGNSLRRMMRLEEALPCAEESVEVFRDLGARWEVASALGDRGTIHRLAGRLEAAERDLREALDLCRQLGERSLVAWTAGELIRVLLASGRRDEARHVLEDPSFPMVTEEPGSKASALVAEALVALTDGDRQTALRLSLQVLEMERVDALPNPLAATTWWVGSLFRADAVGGEDTLREARERLESVHWLHAIKEPELALAWLGELQAL